MGDVRRRREGGGGNSNPEDFVKMAKTKELGTGTKIAADIKKKERKEAQKKQEAGQGGGKKKNKKQQAKDLQAMIFG